MQQVYHGHRMKWKMRSVPYHYIVGCCSLVSAWIEEKDDGLSVCTCNDTSRWPRLSNRHQNMHLTKLHTPFSHIPSQSPLCCPHNGNPNTQKRFFHANVKTIQEKRKTRSSRFIMRPKKTILDEVLAPLAWQSPAFQLCCQQYINLTNTEGYDLFIRAEPKLTSELWSGFTNTNLNSCSYEENQYL